MNKDKKSDSYKNLSMRLKRMHQDLEETAIRFEEEQIYNTIVFFGSAQIIPYKQAQKQMQDVELKFDKSKRRTQKLWDELDHASNAVYMSRYYEAAQELSFRLSKWSFETIKEKEKQFIVCTGGGPGIMEAANLGAKQSGHRSIGLSIDIPIEQSPNLYVTPELHFRFNYFMLRKFWFFHFLRALIIFPGGLGTLDEVFEILTLIKTRKFDRKIPIVLYGSEYWHEVIDFQPMVHYNTIDPEDVKLCHYSSDVDDTFKYIIRELKKCHSL